MILTTTLVCNGTATVVCTGTAVRLLGVRGNVRLTFDLPLDPFIIRPSMSKSAPSDREDESEERRQGEETRRQDVL